jgi:hypothetical protein
LGSTSPDYYLQTKEKDILLQYKERGLFLPDYHLEFFNRRMVEVEGERSGDGNIIRVKNIHEIGGFSIPE